MTLIVLALDALDAGLVDYFDVPAFRLDSSGRMETYAHSQTGPYTPEVWATVATGLGPAEHGVTGSGTSDWSNPVLEAGSRLTSHLSERTRGRLGRLVRRTTGQRERIGATDRETIFDREGAVVRNWPGVTDGHDLQRAWDLMYAASHDMSRRDFERELFGQCAEQFGWAREMLRHDLRLAGVHVHTLDAAGHVYARDEDALAAAYERVAEQVADLRDALGPDDDLLICSDHGMRVAFYPPDADEEPGGHSWRAFAATTTADYPQSVYDVRAWVETHMPERAERDEDDVHVSREQLRDLGYVE